MQDTDNRTLSRSEVFPLMFSYTAIRSRFNNTLITLCCLLFLEGGVLLLVLMLLPVHASFKWGGAALALLLPIIILIKMRAPLHTRHCLTESELTVRYGTFVATVPRALIEVAEPVQKRLSPFHSTTPLYEQDEQQLNVCFSEQGQVLLRLRKPLPLLIGQHEKPVRSILLNVDERDSFLRLLAQEEKTVHHLSGALYEAIPEEQAAITIEGLTARFGSLSAVDNLTIRVRRGEIYGFLGTNGAGKTTTIKMLVGLLQPTAGRITLAGYDIWQEPLPAKQRLGYVADRAILYERLTGREFLTFLASVRRVPRARERISSLLELLDLSEHAVRPCGTYSLGMKRKLSLAGALLHQPDVLVLDEPLNGLDPQSAFRLKRLLSEQAAAGTTIFLSLHDLATAENICQRVGIIHKGRLLAEGSPAELCTLLAAPDLETAFLKLTQGEVNV
uniref:ABC transporter domain-containing protein n=1 Tax=Thermosporothrix sp. COM3 TaxID=2490863 RepID=A0A455SFP3_9CHLR|nr:hypothetical protein KTC_05630 [Thermosporothrix sp. COM3]